MIEHKELGLKIAESKDEAFWTDLKEKIIKAIDTARKDIEINEHLLPLCETKLQELKTNGKPNTNDNK